MLMSTEKMCTTHTFKMSFLWIYCVVVLNSQLKMVLTGQKTFGPKSLESWRETAHGIGIGEYWFFKKDGKLYTQIKQSTTGKPGESWFITPEFGKANLSHINIKALPVECGGKKSCDLIIYGNKKTISVLPVQPDRQFIKDNFERIKTVSFTQNTHGEVNVTIKKAYNRLCIVTTPTKTRTMWNIYSMKLYYNFCDQDGVNKISLPYTNSSDGDISVTGNCLLNSISIDGNTTITAKCSSEGKWTVDNDQICLCNKGFGFGSSKSCLRCLINYYKAEIDDAECVKCPEDRTNNTMNTKCQCLKDHYNFQDKNGPCYAVPPKVKELEIKIQDTFVNVSWQKPLYNGGLNDSLTYGVACYHCNRSDCDKEEENATFKPGKTNLTTTYINIFNLVKKAKYKLRVVSRNSLNLPNDKWKYAEKIFTFETTPGPTESTSKSTESTGEPEDSNMFIYIGAGAAFLVIVLLIIFLVITKLRRAKTYKDGADNRGFDIALPTIGQTTYIDPSNYEDPEAAVREFAKEISPNSFILERVLGGGEFGDVYKISLKTENGGVIEIAAKTLKESHYENPDELDVVLYEEIPYAIRPDENRPDMDEEVEINNLHQEHVEHQSEFATPDDNGTGRYEEDPILTRPVLTEVGEKRPGDFQDNPLIHDLVYVIPLDDQTKPHEGLIAASEKRGTKSIDSVESELIEDNDSYLLAADGEVNMKYATPDDKGTEPQKEFPIITRSVLTVDENRRDDPQQEPSINDLVCVIPLDDQTKPHEDLIAAPEKRTKSIDSVESALIEDNDGYLSAADGEVNMKYATPDDKGTEPHKEFPIFTRSVLTVDENRRDDPQQEPSINDLVYLIPLADQTKPHEDLIVAPEQRTKKVDSLQSEVKPADGETNSTQNEQIIELSPYAKVDRNTNLEKDSENTGVY